MTLEWFGHACFKLSGSGGSVVFDPYADGSVPGLILPPLTASAVICSHGHSDHSAADAVRCVGNGFPFPLRQIPCWHDEYKGAKRGDNLISIVSCDGLTVAHMGDIGHLPDGEMLKALTDIDIMLIPVGGVYTLNAAAAFELVRMMSPRAVVPMHYRSDGFGLSNIAPVSDFLRLFNEDEIHRLPGSVWEIDRTEALSGVYVFADSII